MIHSRIFCTRFFSDVHPHSAVLFDASGPATPHPAHWDETGVDHGVPQQVRQPPPILVIGL
jgi:hypothetical protein